MAKPNNHATTPESSTGILPAAKTTPHLKLSPTQKLQISSNLYKTAKKVKLAALKHLHPDWSPDELQHELKHRFFLLHD